MSRTAKIIWWTLLISITCSIMYKQCSTKYECYSSEDQKYWKEEFLDSIIFIKKDKKLNNSTDIFYQKRNSTSVDIYNTIGVWPFNLGYILKKGDVLYKKKGDTVLQIIRNDTVLNYIEGCEPTINGLPLEEVLKHIPRY